MFQITTSILFVITSLYGSSTAVSTASITTNDTPIVIESNIEISNPNEIKSSKVKLQSNIIESKVRDYFKDNSTLIEIARCESSFRQYNTEGEVLHGKVNPADVGVMQINEIVHGASAKRLGYDLYSTEGNMAFALALYKSEGSKPWTYSGACWKNSVADGEVALK